MDTSIVIPTYNEEENIIPLYKELNYILKNNPYDYEIIFVDDGSTDGTFEKLSALHNKNQKIKVIKLRKNFGQSAAMSAGFDYASGDTVITMDADLQNNPADIPSLIKELSNGFDVVCGWRYERKDSFTKRLFSRLANRLRRVWTGELIHDSGCSLRAYKKQCLDDLEIYGEMHRYIPALLTWKGYKIGEVKITHRYRTKGRSKYSWQRLIKGFLDLILVTFWQRYSLRPMHVFGGLGLLLTTISIVTGIYLVVQRTFFNIELADRPLLLLVILMFIVGIQFIVVGVLADIMIRVYYGQSNRKNYSIEKITE